MSIAFFFLAWAVLAAVFLIGWVRLRAADRAVEGIDEALYAQGPDDAALSDAA
jgi:hypothetical protein